YPAGSAHALARMIMQDTVLHPSEWLAAQLDGLGASMSLEAGIDEWVVSIRCLASVLPDVMGLVVERLVAPGFKASDWDRVKNELKEDIALGIANPGQLADLALTQMIYGRQHPLGVPLWGHSSDVDAMGLDALKGLHEQFFVRANSRVVVVGDGMTPTTLEWVAPLGEIPLGKASPPSQSEVRMGYPTPPWDGLGPFLMMQLANVPIGGVFNSRLNLRLREEKGMTYGVQSYLTAHKTAGYFEAGGSVKKAYTAQALGDMWEIITDVRQSGLTPQELTMIQEVTRRRDAMRYETLDQQVGLLQRIQQFGLPTDYLNARQTLVSGLELNALNQAARALWQGKPCMVVVGDYNEIAPYFDRL
ncbi:insulinase family protein, partial [bacterium]|nr:insulinase family protein [bacterium]